MKARLLHERRDNKMPTALTQDVQYSNIAYFFKNLRVNMLVGDVLECSSLVVLIQRLQESNTQDIIIHNDTKYLNQYI